MKKCVERIRTEEFVSQTEFYVFFQMELDSKDLMIDRLNSQNKQRALNTSITENDELSVSGNTFTWIVRYCRICADSNF